MSDTEKKMNVNDDKNNGNDTFAKVIEFCKKNVRYIAGAALFLVLVLVLVWYSKKDDNNGENLIADKQTETEAVTENQEGYEKDAYPEVNALISNYYTAYANGDNDTLATLATPLSDTEKSYISVFSQYVESYENISCYTKPGLDENSYLVFAYLEMKFKDVETTAPGLEFFYVSTNEDGSLYIDNVYSSFNSKREEYEVDTDISAMIKVISQQEDAIALQIDAQKKYEIAVAADENLKTMVEQTVPDALEAWKNEVNAAAEAKKAEEEAAKKAAEEEAAKKAEEEKAAAERANAVVVYATDKVNVRADASETADVIGQLEAGSKTTRLEERSDGWSRIDYSNGTQGYVKSEYLSTEAPSAEAPAESQTTTTTNSNGFAEGTVITIKESTNIRESMSETAAKVATAFAGEKVTVIMSYAEGWTKVTYGDKTGYIKTELLQ